MKPTHTRKVLGEDYRYWLSERIGKPITEQQWLMVNCFWAGQLGHEKCGWCQACENPRWFECKCKHPIERIWPK